MKIQLKVFDSNSIWRSVFRMHPNTNSNLIIKDYLIPMNTDNIFFRSPQMEPIKQDEINMPPFYMVTFSPQRTKLETMYAFCVLLVKR